MHDAPELFMCICMAVTGYIGAYVLYKYEQKHGVFRGTPYKRDLIVVSCYSHTNTHEKFWSIMHTIFHVGHWFTYSSIFFRGCQIKIFERSVQWLLRSFRNVPINTHQR